MARMNAPAVPSALFGFASDGGTAEWSMLALLKNPKPKTLFLSTSLTAYLKVHELHKLGDFRLQNFYCLLINLHSVWLFITFHLQRQMMIVSINTSDTAVVLQQPLPFCLFHTEHCPHLRTMEWPKKEIFFKAKGDVRRGYFSNMKFSLCVIKRHNPDSERQNFLMHFSGEYIKYRVWITHTMWECFIMDLLKILCCKVPCTHKAPCRGSALVLLG